MKWKDRIKRNALDTFQMHEDIKALIEQIDKIEHEQDTTLIETIAARYGIKRVWQ